MDYIKLAITYGGFTNLDEVYLKGVLEPLSDEQKWAFITPPPSVINAYFAELYQKKSPQAATDYYFELSRNLHLMTETPSFMEKKPFVRLNLSGKSFGFSYLNDEELACVFAENKEEITSSLLFEIAQIFPQYKVFVRKDRIFMTPLVIDEEMFLPVETDYLLTDVAESGKWVKVSGLNQEEVAEAAQDYAGMVYYAWSGQTASMYIEK